MRGSCCTRGVVSNLKEKGVGVVQGAGCRVQGFRVLVRGSGVQGFRGSGFMREKPGRRCGIEPNPEP